MECEKCKTCDGYVGCEEFCQALAMANESHPRHEYAVKAADEYKHRLFTGLKKLHKNFQVVPKNHQRSKMLDEISQMVKRSTYNRENYLRNKEKILARQRERRGKSAWLEKIKQKEASLSPEELEKLNKLRERKRKYYQEHKEKIRKRRKELEEMAV